MLNLRRSSVATSVSSAYAVPSGVYWEQESRRSKPSVQRMSMATAPTESIGLSQALRSMPSLSPLPSPALPLQIHAKSSHRLWTRARSSPWLRIHGGAPREVTRAWPGSRGRNPIGRPVRTYANERCQLGLTSWRIGLSDAQRWFDGTATRD